ncbi:Methyltransferase domain-containing protein [Lachnospiraceae bacterium KH1T2]|nr:Methyltransferase domain-containing protein [Lachnospiraceae bacterium KH1T2]
MLCPEETQDYEVVASIFSNYKSDVEFSVKNVTFIIYSSKLDNTRRCIKSIQATCAKNCYEIIVITNILEPNYDSLLSEFGELRIIDGGKFKNIEEAYNFAIKLSSSDNDLIITNDYAAMLFNSLFMLRYGLYSDANTGISSAIPFVRKSFSINDIIFGDLNKLAFNQNIPKENFIQYHFIIPELCFMIRRECIEAVGYLDTSFNSCDYFSYSFSMNCINLNLNCIKAGYKVWNNHACCIVSSRESINMNDNDVDNKRELHQKLIQRHGFTVDYYSQSRDDLIEFVNNDFSCQMNVLEVGCGLGTTLNTIKYKFPNANVYGIELVRDVAKYASVFTDVRCGDIESMELDYPQDYFDYIIFGDVLEHLRNPIAVLERLKPHFKKDGYVLTRQYVMTSIL